MAAPPPTPLLYTRPAVFATAELERPQMPDTPTLVRAGQAPHSYDIFTTQGVHTHDSHATAHHLGLLQISTNGGEPFHPAPLISALLDPPRIVGGWRSFPQIVVYTPQGRANMDAISCLKEQCTHPDYAHTPHDWWMGRACLLGLPTQPVEGQHWRGAPAALHTTPILPVFRLPNSQDSAHATLCDSLAIAQDLALLAQITARSLSHPRPFGTLAALHTVSPSA